MFLRSMVSLKSTKPRRVKGAKQIFTQEASVLPAFVTTAHNASICCRFVEKCRIVPDERQQGGLPSG